MNKFLWATVAAPVLIFIIYIFLSFTNLSPVNYTFLITAIGVTATLYIGLVKYWIDSDTMFKSLFKDFNERFDLLSEDLNKIVEDMPLSGVSTSDQIIQKYLNLCAEEYYWFRNGRIRKKVWSSWLAGIHYYLLAPSIKAYFAGQLKQKNSYYGFMDFIKKEL